MANLNIGVIGLWNARNLGDPLICESVEYLLHQAIDRSDCKIFPIDLFPEHLSLPKVTLSRLLANGKIKDDGIVSYIDSFLMETTVLLLKLENKYRKYFEETFDQLDCVIFAGGLIKFKQQQKLSIAISSAVKVASKMDIPVAFHACGVEGYNPRSKGCKRLSKAMNDPIVKFVSTRDDFETLANFYKKNPNLVVRSAADAAVWADQVTGIQKDESSKIIGLGIARADIFQEYGIDFNENELIDLFISIIKSLQRRGISWRLFCNGYAPDYKFGCKILSELDLDESYIMPFPKNTRELVSQISNFQGVVALRLHACIISYSLNIPVLGLCWNQKLKQFGNAIGYPDRFYEVDDFDAEVITKHLLKAIHEGYDHNEKKEYIQSSLDSIKEIVKILLPQ